MYREVHAILKWLSTQVTGNQSSSFDLFFRSNFFHTQLIAWKDAAPDRTSLARSLSLRGRSLCVRTSPDADKSENNSTGQRTNLNTRAAATAALRQRSEHDRYGTMSCSRSLTVLINLWICVCGLVTHASVCLLWTCEQCIAGGVVKTDSLGWAIRATSTDPCSSTRCRSGASCKSRAAAATRSCSRMKARSSRGAAGTTAGWAMATMAGNSCHDSLKSSVDAISATSHAGATTRLRSLSRVTCTRGAVACTASSATGMRRATRRHTWSSRSRACR